MAEIFEHHGELSLAHFREHGWMRVPQAFGAEAAAAMRDAVWAVLAETGIERDRPETWTVERPAHLQRLKADPVFQAVGSRTLLAAIDAVLEGRAYDVPKNWGGFFIAFPTETRWAIPASGWHIDANYVSPLWPAGGVKTFALLDDVALRGGGTLMVSGSHRLVHRWFAKNPPLPGVRSVDMRKRLLSHPYIGALHEAGDRDARIARFMDREEEHDGVALRVVETTGAAGDVILAHPLLMHVAAPNNTARPRFLLSGGVTLDDWGWGAL
ncbi:MAG: phytanoyl-CoA dioxygenase family protein [Sphingobium sp.]|nr:phytanoyl-CoA dioxygenase family protein [Sphingobium sp.]